MKDEEKARKYFEDSKDYYDSREPITDRQLRQIYLDGLTEGRKESCEVCEKEGIKEYQKLFDKQRKIIEKLKKENEQLKQQIEQLSNDNHVLKTAFITQQEQIEEMKNFYNCNHSSRALCPNEHNCKGCKDWGLADE